MCTLAPKCNRNHPFSKQPLKPIYAKWVNLLYLRVLFECSVTALYFRVWLKVESPAVSTNCSSSIVFPATDIPPILQVKTGEGRVLVAVHLTLLKVPVHLFK